MNATPTKLRYGRKLNAVTGELDGIVSYTEPDTGDEIILIVPPNKRIFAYRNAMPTEVTRVMVMIWTEVAGLLGSIGILGGLGF